ncbi:hypothetical protein EVAR_79274_1 [Eumeta japonica]|uniref:Uncharacterized protein n=1 Tax=Eumeta variegata TaxID=151549 RepID=A0A4C1THK9_EUMVA|nr:hypothetical protein EVAR_79274_1 [Eumeta japonica]
MHRTLDHRCCSVYTKKAIKKNSENFGDPISPLRQPDSLNIRYPIFFQEEATLWACECPWAEMTTYSVMARLFRTLYLKRIAPNLTYNRSE